MKAPESPPIHLSTLYPLPAACKIEMKLILNHLQNNRDGRQG